MNGTTPPSSRTMLCEMAEKCSYFFVLAVIAIVSFLTDASTVIAQSVPVTVGYRDFAYNPTADNEPAAEKPQSKLWWNDGSWWGSLWSNALNAYAIFRFDAGTQSWTSTGTVIDDRNGSKADALWDGTHLYIVSGIHTLMPGPASAAQSGRLYRYSYHFSSQSYSLDAGFPVTVNSSISETLVLDKDATGKLWVTWTEGGKVKVNCTIGDDLSWGSPFDLPVQGNLLNSDDISSVVALGSGKIGVAWNNGFDNKFYFAVHLDGDAVNLWQPREEALADAVLGPVADDHLNMKMSSDGSGNLYAAVKTALTAPEAPHIYVLKRTVAGVWSRHLVAKVKDGHTRPIMLLDTDNQKAYIFFMSDVINGKDEIYMKSASLSDLLFPEGTGTPFILSSTDTRVNNPSSTKQCVNTTTGLLVLADDHNTRRYLHNDIDLNSVGTPSISAFSPASGIASGEVTITGNNFDGATGVNFNGMSTSFILNVDSNSQIRAQVPPGATSGKIEVTTVGGAAQSAADFTVVPTISSFTPTSGLATAVVTITGANFTDAISVQFHGAPAAGFTIVSATQLTAIVPTNATTGKVSVTTAGGGTDFSVDDFVVIPSTISSLNPVHDSWVRFSTPTTTNGPSATIRARTSTADTLLGYLKFDVSGLSGAVLNAKIRLNVTNASVDAGTVFLVSNNLRGTSTAWLENALNWNNAPLISTAPLSSNAAAAVGNWVEFDVTPAIAGNDTYSFALRNNSTDDIQYSSKEGANKPELVIQTSTSPATPSIISFNPASGLVGAVVTINGSNFVAVSDVKFNATSATTFTVNSATLITATVPGGATSGKISLSTPGGVAVSAMDFTVIPPAPGVSSFSPTSGPVGSLVTINGSNFDGASDVKFNAASATAFTVNSATQITVTVPAGATSGKISVTTPGGVAVSAGDFIITIPPTISSFTPTSGTAGAQVTITGTNFTGASDVKFNATSATAFAVNSATQIIAAVPFAATTGAIHVTTNDGTAVSATNFTVLTPAPTISSFTPTSGTAGAQVTITGTNFTGASDVKFNATSATAFAVNSATQITATVPVGASTGTISVTANGTGVSASSFTVSSGGSDLSFQPSDDAYVRFSTATSNYGTATSLRARLVAGSDTLNIFLKFPVSGIAGTVQSAKLRLRVSDASADGGSVYLVSNSYKSTSTPWVQSGITWNNAPVIGGTALSNIGAVSNGTWVEFNVTPAVTGDGIYSFAIRTTSSDVVYYDSQETTNKPQLHVQVESGPPATPVISAFVPTSGPVGSLVTISGSNLSGTSVLKFNATSATSFTVNSATQITATVPIGATSGKVSVTTAGGTALSATDFTVSAAPVPTITSFTPTSVTVGTQITITGTNFTGATEVKFNTTNATTFTVNSATQIRVTVPTGATSGKISVTTAGGTAQSATDFTVTTTPAPTITSFSPSSGTVGIQVTITGTNFTGASGVTFNGVVAATFTVNSSTQIRATVPNGATSGLIGVTTGGGTALSASNFTATVAAPTISSFTPVGGAEGINVTILGTNLTGATDVKFNTTSAVAFTVNSATQISATVPSGATSGKISVTTAGGTVSSTDYFTVTAPGISVIIFNPTHDTYVRKGSPTSNFGTRSTVIVKKTSSDTYNAYFKFNVSGLSGSVINAKLRVMVKNSSNDGGGAYLVSNTYLGTATPWMQTGMNWNNAPTIGGSALSSIGTVANNTIVEFDVTAAIAGDGTYSFGIQNNSTNDVQYSTLEGTFKPELVVQASASSIAVRQEFSDVPAGKVTGLPERFSLSPNYPNPFNGQTTIEYALPHEANVRLLIYNSIGQLVRKLVDQKESAGYKRMLWDVTDDHGYRVGSGIYFYQLEAEGQHLSGRMIFQQ